jgi:hypothetical protein
LRLLPDARSFSARAASKIRSRERGWEYAVEQLVAHGATAPTAGEDLRPWLAAQLPRITRTMRHQGNYRYLLGLTEGARRFGGRRFRGVSAARGQCGPVRRVGK